MEECRKGTTARDDEIEARTEDNLPSVYGSFPYYLCLQIYLIKFLFSIVLCYIILMLLYRNRY